MPEMLMVPASASKSNGWKSESKHTQIQMKNVKTILPDVINGVTTTTTKTTYTNGKRKTLPLRRIKCDNIYERSPTLATEEAIHFVSANANKDANDGATIEDEDMANINKCQKCNLLRNVGKSYR